MAAAAMKPARPGSRAAMPVTISSIPSPIAGEAELLLGFCDNCGPAFLLGYVGSGILGSSRAGAYLYLVHVLGPMKGPHTPCRQSASPSRSSS